MHRLRPIFIDRRRALLTTVTVALLFGAGTASSAAAQQGAGAKFGARDPHTCANATAPASGPPTAAQAAAYVACHIEGVQSYNLYLISDVQVQVGKGTAYRELPGSERPFTADPDGLVYAIRGSYKKYQCSAPSSGTPAGQNCNRYDEARATGTCFRDKFGEWVCNMADYTFPNPVPHQPPPRS